MGIIRQKRAEFKPSEADIRTFVRHQSRGTRIFFAVTAVAVALLLSQSWRELGSLVGQ